MLVETISIKSLFNKSIQQVGTAEIRIPSILTLELNPSTPVSLRVSFLFKNNFCFSCHFF
jgi:hypothetical protein